MLVVAVLFVVVVVVGSCVMLLLYPSVTLITCTLVRSVRLIRCNAACPKMRRVGGEGVQMKLASVLQTDQTDTDTYMAYMIVCMAQTHTQK